MQCTSIDKGRLRYQCISLTEITVHILLLFSFNIYSTFTADLNQSEAFLIEQTVNCLCLFALSTGEYATAADTSRYVLKRQSTCADAGIWVMRGLAFAAMGRCLRCCFLVILKFSIIAL